MKSSWIQSIGCAVLWASGFANAAAQELILSEFLASNNSGLLDEDGDASDWIEIHNPGSDPVLLDGWFLTDDANDLTRWRLPNVTVPGQGFQIVFASGKDRSPIEGELHANFSMDRNGEYLALVRPDGRTVSHEFAPAFPRQVVDVSFGARMIRNATVLTATNALGRISVPANDDWGLDWTLPAFDDGDWMEVEMGVGYALEKPDEPDPPSKPVETIEDVVSPLDSIEPTSLNSPAGEGAANAIDDNPETKYLNFDKLNAGLTVTPSVGAVAVTGLRLTSANDSPDRDPTRFTLLGSQDGVVFVPVASGPIPDFTDRFQTVEATFSNDQPYAHYRLLFPEVRDPDLAVAMQIAEVEFLGVRSVGSAPPMDLSDVSQPDDPIEATSLNSPVNEEVWRAIDNDPNTKYLNFDGVDSGFTVEPAAGPTVVRGLRLTSANDAPERDPTRFKLEGSNDGFQFTPIAEGDVPGFSGRFTEVEVQFANDQPFTAYRLLFPELSGGPGSIMQIAEVEFLGSIGTPAPAFEDLIRTNVEDLLFQRQTSLYIRLPFTVEADQAFESLTLNMRYDDGFIAYLNGVEIARANAPDSPAHDAAAIVDRESGKAALPERFGLANAGALLRSGENVLAIHALNDAVDSPEFLLEPQLEHVEITLENTGYFETPTPGGFNSNPSFGLVAAPSIEAESGFKSAPFDVVLSTETEGAAIRYTTDGSSPTDASGEVFSGPIRIEETTVLRAAAFRQNWRPSPIETRTYLFLSDVVQQDREASLAKGLPPDWRGQGADYGFDERVIGTNGQDNYGGKYARTIEEDLLSLPSLSIVMDVEDLFGQQGIYSNPNSRGGAWERAATVELIFPDGQEGFREDAGIRIQGGAFRRFDLSLKKSFRLIFREEYGAAKLEYPFFGPDAAEEFDNIVLRANSNDAWRWGGDRSLYIRDAFAMETARAMGMTAPHTRFVHLYLNGFYWGLYNPVERPDAAFSASYHGGGKDSWDAINQDSTPDGNRDAWNRMSAILNEGMADNEVYQRIQGKNPDGSRNPELENLLDIENMIDYMILNFYVGNADWPHRNYWVGRNREGGEGFQFYPWDTETAIGLNSDLNADRTGVNQAVAAPYAAARANAEFRIQFADRVHRRFFNGGALHVNPSSPDWNPATPENNRPAARIAGLASTIERAIVAESARWGDQLSNSPFTPDEHWRTELNDLLENYFPRRSEIVLEQFRRAGLYPQVDAPVFNQHGGRVASGFELSMDASAGTIFYTLDGSDPRTPIEVDELSRFPLVDGNNEKRVLIPSPANGGDSLGTDWRSQINANDESWTEGMGGVGYDTDTNYRSLIGVDVEAEMRGVNGSAFIRIPFEWSEADPGQLNYMTLRMRYDDGFVAYLNGVEIASANKPNALSWDSFATGTNDDSAAVLFQDFDAGEFLGALRPGDNLLAIQGLNASLGSSDFLIDAELIAGERRIIGGQPTARAYQGPIALQDLTTVKARTLAGSEWSALNEARFVVGTPRLIVSELLYHPSALSDEERQAGFDDENAFEFIELYNPGPTTYDLTGIHFVDGIEFDFTGSSIELLPPQSHVLVVKSRAAFEYRYGAAGPVAGEYGGQFANDGERVALADAEGNTILEFAYEDESPWPEAADGDGSSLSLINPDKDPGDPGNWQASVEAGGSPGRQSAEPGIHIEGYSMDSGEFRIRFEARAGQEYAIYYKEDLLNGDWRPLGPGRQAPSNGPLEIAVEMEDAPAARFFRIQASRTP